MSRKSSQSRTAVGQLDERWPARDEQFLETVQRHETQKSTRLKQKAAEEPELRFPELADGLRTMIQRRAGLTEQEMRVVDEVATQDLQARANWVAQLKMARLPSQRITLEMLARDGTITRTPELAAQAPSGQSWHKWNVKNRIHSRMGAAGRPFCFSGG